MENNAQVGFALFSVTYFSVPEYLPVNLGASLGKVSTGSHTTAGFKEDKRNKATPGNKSCVQSWSFFVR